jgi:hypothetical protein
MRFISIFILLLFFVELQAQSTYNDQVHLKNGSVLRCKIIEYKPDNQIKLEIQGGSVLVYSAAEVSMIDRGAKSVPLYEKKEAHTFSKELYFSIFFNIIGGYRESSLWFGRGDVLTLGCGYKFSIGKALNRHLMLGAGAGWAYMHNYFMYSAHFPVFAEVRGDLLKKSNSLYYSFAVGYNIARLRGAMSWTGLSMQQARGGLFLNPALGLRFASKDKKHFCLELNYGIHTASFTYTGTNGESIGPTKNIFIRPTLSVGMLF